MNGLGGRVIVTIRKCCCIYFCNCQYRTKQQERHPAHIAIFSFSQRSNTLICFVLGKVLEPYPIVLLHALFGTVDPLHSILIVAIESIVRIIFTRHGTTEECMLSHHGATAGASGGRVQSHSYEFFVFVHFRHNCQALEIDFFFERQYLLGRNFLIGRHTTTSGDFYKKVKAKAKGNGWFWFIGSTCISRLATAGNSGASWSFCFSSWQFEKDRWQIQQQMSTTHHQGQSARQHRLTVSVCEDYSLLSTRYCNTDDVLWSIKSSYTAGYIVSRQFLLRRGWSPWRVAIASPDLEL